MDSLIRAAARALAAGDPLSAMKRIALRDDAPALALRGIAMAQLGDFTRARALVRRAARAFGPADPVARARCTVAEAEVALASRDLAWPARALEEALQVLQTSGDRANAAHARCLEIRRCLLIGRIGEAQRMLAEIDASSLPPTLEATHQLMSAGVEIRKLKPTSARSALIRAERAAHLSGVPALMAEVESALRVLKTPAARLLRRGEERVLQLDEVEALLASPKLVVDGCRRIVRDHRSTVLLAKRPVLFALARALGEAWPQDATRDALIVQAFGASLANDSHRARLRVEIGRLRALLRPMAVVSATSRGFALLPRRARAVAVLAPPVEGEHAAILAFLSDGMAWSSSALSLALGASQRTVQRGLESLAAEGKVHSFGRARARRWMAQPLPGFTTVLLLPVSLPAG